MHDLQTVLSLPQDAMYLALGDYLTARVDAVGLSELIPIERDLWLSWEFHWAMRQDGLLRYLVLKTDGYANDAERALRTIGAVQAADALHDAVAARKQLADAFWDACDKVSLEVQDLPVFTCDYARANRDALLTNRLPQ